MERVSEIIATAIVQPISSVVAPHSRFFFLYLLSAALIALVVVYFRQPKEGGRSIRRALAGVFSRKVFTHPSAILDYKFAIINHLIDVVILGFVVINAFVLTYLFRDGFAFLFGEVGSSEPGWTARILYTLAVLLVVDGSLFFAHWLHHRLPILWEFHKVHHSAKILTPITVLRIHPFETLLNSFVQAITLGLCNGAFLYLYTAPVAQLTVIGANVLNFVLFFAGYHLRHSHVWIMFPKRIAQHISSPALHLIHHSNDPKHYDRNFARFFTFWDRLAGTLYIPEREEKLEYGVDDHESNELLTVKQLYWTPIRNAWAIIRGRQAVPTAGRTGS